VTVGEGRYAWEHCIVFCGSEVDCSLHIILGIICVFDHWGGECAVAGLGGEC